MYFKVFLIFLSISLIGALIALIRQDIKIWLESSIFLGGLALFYLVDKLFDFIGFIVPGLFSAIISCLTFVYQNISYIVIVLVFLCIIVAGYSLLRNSKSVR